MSSRRTKPQPLSDTEIRQIAADIAGGRPPMVWFTAAAVGIPEGRSGKVVALGEPSEGDFLQVRPTGSKDVLSFSPTEVTLTKPARRQPAAAAKSSTAKKTTATRKDTAVTMPPTVHTPAPTPAPEPAKPAAAEPNSPAKPADAAPKPAAKPSGAAPKPAKSAAARKPKAPEVTVTLSGTTEGEWTVDVVNGKKRTVRGLPVSGAAVAQAAKLLHPEVAEVVDSILESVRTSQRAKVEQLQAELEQARKLLDELTD
ncbi:hypothetical protein IU500_18015 [Nocardia terpenica]|uniref:DUF6319 family protein n=1 Tax=Nocardia terpenica TaxID=455432 RepID=UPI0018954961|nr:DUF6319 family protein [Nocardia terpenica]MBF6063383.1 hypothetical protein [Nocardia terpenica]MBF6105939.1 hypothetical protein [Nocardia terpenica]MBF6113477.1 hypothetical protein [Nocardia terpenica]MBF6119680.1 hypothetical protein [Nocardia terpenica]MBF6152091.1 hypothetical protein [Nocardia terpenica]